MRVGELCGLAGRLAVDQARGPMGALNVTTQSRMICTVTPPIRAAAVRLAPS
jgi:hypothetical protein